MEETRLRQRFPRCYLLAVVIDQQAFRNQQNRPNRQILPLIELLEFGSQTSENTMKRLLARL